jgi:DNA-binding transcriptional ArsR family regulator
VAPPDPPQLSYRAKAAGTLWEARPLIGADAVTTVLGRTRAALLLALEFPASTTELAAQTGISAPGVSQQLSGLRAAGLVSAHRAGRSVLYARTSAAETLLAAAAGLTPQDGP